MREAWGFYVNIRANLIWQRSTPTSVRRTSEPEDSEQAEYLGERLARRFAYEAQRRTAAEVSVETLYARKASLHLGQLAHFSFSTFDEWERWRARFQSFPAAMSQWVENVWADELGPGVLLDVRADIEPFPRTPTRAENEEDSNRPRAAGPSPASDTPSLPAAATKASIRSDLNAMISFAVFFGLVLGATLMFLSLTAMHLDQANNELSERLNNYEQSLSATNERSSAPQRQCCEPCCVQARRSCH